MADRYTKNLPEPRRLAVVDFFSGCGGVSVAFKETRSTYESFNVLAGIDIEADALETYSANIGAPGLCENVQSIADDPERLNTLIPELASARLEAGLVFIGCAPCQGFSAHRKKDLRDDRRNNLMLAFAKICTYHRPDFVVMENVPEILKGRFSHYYSAAKSEFQRAGYHVTEDILDLSLFGVPQRRKRAVVFASLRAPISLPSAPLSSVDVRTVRDAIGHLRPLSSGEQDPFDPAHRSPRHIPRILQKIAKIPANGGDRRNLPAEEQLACHQTVDDGATPGFTDVYGRLRWDAPSVTITAKSSTPSCGRFLHPEQHRNITPREAAILQGFPHTYEFKGSFVNQYRQIGEAVPPLFARFLAKAILDASRPRGEPLIKSNAVAGPSSTPKPLVVDAFCGAGGMSLGFDNLGFKSAFAFDVDCDAIATYNANLGNGHVSDVRSELTRAGLSAAVGDQRFVLVGGPPCQGFSQQRRGSDDDPRNSFVLEYAKLVQDLKNRPAMVVLENVTYLNSPRGRTILLEYCAMLEALNYEVQQFELNSAEFGVPQLRRRRIVIARRNDQPGFLAAPRPLEGRNWPTVGEALIGLPAADGRLPIANHEVSSEGDANRRRIAYVDMGRGRLAIPPDLQLPCHSTYNGHLDVYGRLDWFGQARTITGGFDSFTRGEFGHPFFNRSITHREAARLQGFPDDFVFIGNKAAVRRQIGNAVPPPLGQALAATCLRAMGLLGGELLNKVAA